MRYLLDTNTVSYFIRNDPKVVAYIQKAKPSEIAISSVTVMELRYGVIKRNSKKLARLVDTFIGNVSVIAFDEDSANEAGMIRGKMEKKGLQISLADCQIAGTARAKKVTVVSSDSVFKAVPGLKTINWCS